MLGKVSSAGDPLFAGMGFSFTDPKGVYDASAYARGASLHAGSARARRPRPLPRAKVDGRTVSTVVSIAGGLLGGAFVSKLGLRRTLVFLAVCLNVPHLCYAALSQAVTPDHAPGAAAIYAFVSLEKLGYSFGFVGNMLYMMQELAPGPYKMTHYAFATALMNLVLVPTQMVSGPLADYLGYKRFFLLVLVASVPSVVAAARAPFGASTRRVDAEPDTRQRVVTSATHVFCGPQTSGAQHCELSEHSPHVVLLHA
jgi:hypothetical protein